MSFLYKTFIEICEKDGLPKVSFTCFDDHYNLNYNYGFVMPRTDVCNDCYQNLNIGEASLTEQQRLDFNLHLKQVQDFKKLKSHIFENLCDKLIIEMDYCQNNSLPSLPVADNFYARKFWLFLCNVHVHYTKQFYMFYFYEGEYKRGPNTIATFLFEVINEIDLVQFNEIIIISDSCFAQNKNSVVFKALVLLLNMKNIKITHLYPVVGHTYNICYRNFSNFTKRIKRIEKIEELDDYLRILTDLKFIVRKAKVLDFEKYFQKVFNTQLKVEISKLFKIVYLPNAIVSCYHDYNGQGCVWNFIDKIDLNAKIQLDNDKSHYISNAKISDVLELVIKYLPKDKQNFYFEHLNKFKN